MRAGFVAGAVGQVDGVEDEVEDAAGEWGRRAVGMAGCAGLQRGRQSRGESVSTTTTR